jgi:uncharacterized membrane protein
MAMVTASTRSFNVGTTIGTRKQGVESRQRRRRSGGHRGWATNGSSARMEGGWVKNKATVVAPVPIQVAWELWQDRTRIPNWMPWISSVSYLPEDRTKTKWTLSTDQFGQHFEFSWLAQDLEPVKYEQISWESLEGLKNKGSVSFSKVPNGTKLEMEISYEVPAPLVPFGSAVSPLVESILAADLKRFSTFSEKVADAMSKK